MWKTSKLCCLSSLFFLALPGSLEAQKQTWEGPHNRTVGAGDSVVVGSTSIEDRRDSLSDDTGLTLDQVLELARESSPRYRAALFGVDAVAAREAGAGLLPDPIFQVGVMNLALPDFSPNMPASMAPAFQATQRFPLAGKRSLRGEMARQATEIQGALAQETWLTVKAETALVFYEIYELDRRLAVRDENLALLRDFERIARSLYASGSGPQADVLRAALEIPQAEAEIRRLQARRAGAASRLNALLDRPAETPVPSPLLGKLPASLPDAGTLRGWALEGRPLLQGARKAVDRSRTRTKLAHREIWPDLMVGVQYGLGRMNGDLKSMGGASLGFSVPLFAGDRQLKVREEASAAQALAEARYDEKVASVNASIAALLADLEETRVLIRIYREEILPQASATVESSLASYRAASVDFMTLVDAQMAANRFQEEYFELLARYGSRVTRLELTIGRDLPVTTPLLLEAS